MGARPSKPTDEQRAELETVKSEAVERAAAVIRQSDVLVLMTGAGWSADSGLAVYADVADMPAYHERGLTYHDLCKPAWLEDDPALFLGFWGSCFNDYRNVMPHEGYRIVASWRNKFFHHTSTAAHLRQATGAGAFFSFTSNVDAHAYQHFSPDEVRECHGNSETWQCARRRCPGPQPMGDPDAVSPGTVGPDMAGPDAIAAAAVDTDAGAPAAEPEDEQDVGAVAHSNSRSTPLRWAAPAGFRFQVDAETMLAPAEGGPAQPVSPESVSVLGGVAAPSSAEQVATAFASNWPKCIGCGGAARPAILMFSDSQWHDDEEQSERWETWRAALENLARERGAEFRLTLVEAGAGGNVTTIRNLSEDILESVRAAGATATLVRINPELPLADRRENQPHTFSLLSKGLDAIRAIDAAMGRPPRPGDGACLMPPALATVKEEEEQRSVSGAMRRPMAATSTMDEGGEGGESGEEETEEDLSSMAAFDRWDALQRKLNEKMHGAISRLQQGLD